MKTEAITTILVAGAFLLGYRLASYSYGQDIAELREDYAARAEALGVKHREKEQAQYRSLVEAWEERDAALARVDYLTGDVERVRKQADAARRRLSAVTAGSCGAEREQLARCADLLERGTELVRRGVELSERTAIDKDAMAIIVSQ